MRRLGAGLAIGIALSLGAGGCASGGSGATAPGKPRATASQPSGLRTDLQPPPPEETVRDAIAATRTLTSVHVTGGATFDGIFVRVRLSVAQDGSCTGKIAFPGRGDVMGDLVSDGSLAYLRGSEAFYQTILGTHDGSRLAELLRGRWWTAPTSANPLLSEVCSLDHYRGFFDMADVRRSVAVERGALVEIYGDPVREMMLNQKLRNLHAWVAEGDGPPYIVRIEMPGDDSHPSWETGEVTFSAFDTPFTVKVPSASETFNPKVSV